jgi:hypothetical protein
LRRRADEKQRIAVGSDTDDELSSDIGAGTRATLDDKGLAEAILERLTEQPRYDVGTASRGERHDHVDGSVRIGLCIRGP